MKRGASIIVVLIVAALPRITWKLYTGYTFEDAFITFRYARNLAEGLGFVYNAGERVLGTTTPLFTLIMAGWEALFPGTPAAGAAFLGLAAGLASIALAWSLLDGWKVNRAARLLAVFPLALSDKLWVRDTGGMETPLVICAMMASLWLLARGRQGWAGAAAGLLLLLRIDGLAWVAVLLAGEWASSRRFPFRFALAAALVILPWAVFAYYYFGSPIPHTVLAKSVAYAAGRPPLLRRAEAVLRGLAPFSLPYLPVEAVKWAGAAALALAAAGAAAHRRRVWPLALAAFCLLEAARLVFTGATFEARYFVPLFWTALLLAGLGAAAAWERLSERVPFRRVAGAALILLYAGASLWFSGRQALSVRETQSYVYEASLTAAGRWLNENTPPSAVVYLEPLGYAGYHAARRMIDDVGLVSPEVTALKRRGYDSFMVVDALDPDYILLHCDDAARAPVSFLSRHMRAAVFNPMGFEPGEPQAAGRLLPDGARLRNPANPRAACYQVWRRILPAAGAEGAAGW